MAMPFPLDLFEQAMAGNWIAWATIGLGVTVLGMLVFVLILWWKMPQLAKSSFLNETVGKHNPTVLQVLETRRVRFINPTMLRNGFAYDSTNRQMFLPPKLWVPKEGLTAQEQMAVEDTYYMEGSNQPLYVKYSVQAIMMNPAIVAFMQNSKYLKAFAEKGAVVDKAVLIDMLTQIPDKKISFKPVNFTFPIDVPRMKTAIAESFSDSDFGEFENKVRADERGSKTPLMIGAIIGVLTVILVVVDIVINFI